MDEAWGLRGVGATQELMGRECQEGAEPSVSSWVPRVPEGVQAGREVHEQ